MKKTALCILLCILMLLPLIEACGPEENDPITPGISAELFASSQLTIPCSSEFSLTQPGTPAGACTHNGVLYYALLLGDGRAQICRRTLADGKTETGPAQELGDAVSLCYNTAENRLVVAHGDTSLSVVDPDTLKVVSTHTVSKAVTAIAYNEREGGYLIRSTGKASLLMLDAAFETSRIFTLPDSTSSMTLGDITAHGAYAFVLVTEGISSAHDNRAGVLIYELDTKRCLKNVFDHDPGKATPISLSMNGSAFMVGVQTNGTVGSFFSGTLKALEGDPQPADLLARTMDTAVDTKGLSAKHLFEVYKLDSALGPNNVLQGGCADGQYGYYCMEDQANNYTETSLHRTCIVKVDLTTNKLVDVSDPLPLDHSNDMCYNARLDKLIVVHCGKDDASRKISFVDPDSLEITDSAELPYSIFSMAYDPVTDRYVIGLGGGRDFAILDGELNVLVSRYKAGSSARYCDKTTLLTQGADCDSEYIYFVQSGRNDNEAWTNYLVVYDWDGHYIFAKILPDCTAESENISHIGTTFYVGFNGGTDPVYSFELTD